MDPFGTLRGHYSLKTDPEVKSDLIFHLYIYCLCYYVFYLAFQFT